ncbi:SRPBCC family protein OS=Streptomyces griseomycini OX=66895 GN=FHS37_000357 PE=4 SV=1 [Streptomyces griseomycini]
MRLVQRLTWDRPAATDVPEAAGLLHAALPVADHQDAFAVEWRPGMPADPEAWNVLPGDPSVVEYDGAEGLYGEDGKHLTYRVSVLVDESARRVTMSSRVRPHDRWGRLHWALVRRAHPVAARLLLRRAHRRLALAALRAGERHASHLVSDGVDAGSDPVVLMS